VLKIIVYLEVILHFRRRVTMETRGNIRQLVLFARPVLDLGYVFVACSPLFSKWSKTSCARQSCLARGSWIRIPAKARRGISEQDPLISTARGAMISRIAFGTRP
jgi:hypothetical protein